MNFSGLGGITLVVVAALWLFVFLPSWFNASAERFQEKSQVREVKRAVVAARKPILKARKTKAASLSEQVFRADRTVRVFSVFSWFFALTGASLGFAVTRFSFLAAPLIVSVVLALIALRGLAMAKAAQRRLLVGSIRSRANASSTALSAIARASAEQLAQVRLAQAAHRQAATAADEWAQAREAERRAREFTIEPIPKPTYATVVGSLEVPVLATVVDLGEKSAAAASASIEPQEVNAETITDILRRRRQANG